MPAILNGWADRVLSHGFAYTDERLFEQGLLSGRRAMLSVSTGGSAAELAADSVHTGTKEQFLKPFQGGVLAFVGMRMAQPFVAYAIGSLTDADRTGVLQSYRSHLMTQFAPAQDAR